MSKNKTLRPGNKAPSGLVQTTDDRAIEISSLWADGPVVLTFLRQFG